MAATAVGRAAGDGLERCVELECACLLYGLEMSFVFVVQVATGAM